MNEDQKKKVFEGAGFKCAKCEYYSPLGSDLSIINSHVLCSICSIFAPKDDRISSYASESLDWQTLESFRKHLPENNLKKGMAASAQRGKPVSRPPFGYNMVAGELTPAENSDEVREVFEAFAKGSSLNQLARIHKISVNGIKKILKNFTYIGKIKFDSQISQGNHQPLISSELFNQVQQRFES